MFCVPFSLCDKCVYWLNFLTEYELKSIEASIFCFNDVNHSHHYICFDLHFFPSLEHTLWFIIACMTTKTIEVSDMVSLQCNFFCAVKPQKNHMIWRIWPWFFLIQRDRFSHPKCIYGNLPPIYNVCWSEQNLFKKWQLDIRCRPLEHNHL